jgi:hypothetical protein
LRTAVRCLPANHWHSIAVVLSALLLGGGAAAREVDNYLAWGADLSDSAAQVDNYMRARLSRAITFWDIRKWQPPRAKSPQSEDDASWYRSCYGTAERLVSRAFYNPTYQKIEKFIDQGNHTDIYPRRPTTTDWNERLRLGQTPDKGYMTDGEYRQASIVKTSPLNVPFSRIVNINGVYTGADKLGHFTSFGVRYWRNFSELISRGASRSEAFDAVMASGYASEVRLVGMLFTKVFSRGDLEANFQGMQFISSLCQDGDGFGLVFADGEWQLKNLAKFSIADYVNPNWDESYNSSLFTDSTWENVVTMTFEQRNDCEKLGSDWVVRQRKLYDRLSARSPNTLYGETWIPENFRGKDIDEHSLDRYCECERGAAASGVAED